MNGPDKRHKSRSKDKQSEGTSGDLHLEDSEEGNMVADPPGRSFRAERMPRITGQSVLNSKAGGPSWLSFSDCQVRADQVQIAQMTTQDVVATMADRQMKAIQYQINLAARAGRFLRESDKKNDQLERSEKRYADKVMELETAMTSHSADLKELTIERKKNAELEATFQKLKLENEAEKTARETDKAKAGACFRKIIEELEKSGPVLRMEAARAFMKSRTFKEFLVDQIVSDLKRALKVGVGQLKKKGLLTVDFEEYDINFLLDANGEVPPDSEEVDDRVLVEDEFFELLEFDPTSEADKDSFFEEISRLKLTIASEAKEAGLTLLGCRSIDSGVVGHKGTGWKDLADSSRTTEKAAEKEVSDGTSPA